MPKYNLKNNRAKDVTPAEHKLVVKFAKKCLRELGKVQYDLPDFDGDFEVKTVYNSSMCAGGWDGIEMSLKSHRIGLKEMAEYASFQHDPEIGTYRGRSADDALFCAVAHEVAHYIQHRYMGRRKAYQRAHGEGWKHLYRALRATVVPVPIRNGDA